MANNDSEEATGLTYLEQFATQNGPQDREPSVEIDHPEEDILSAENEPETGAGAKKKKGMPSFAELKSTKKGRAIIAGAVLIVGGGAYLYLNNHNANLQQLREEQAAHAAALAKAHNKLMAELPPVPRTPATSAHSASAPAAMPSPAPQSQSMPAQPQTAPAVAQQNNPSSSGFQVGTPIGGGKPSINSQFKINTTKKLTNIESQITELKSSLGSLSATRTQLARETSRLHNLENEVASNHRALDAIEHKIEGLTHKAAFSFGRPAMHVLAITRPEHCPYCQPHALVDFRKSTFDLADGDTFSGYKVHLSADRLTLKRGKHQYSYYPDHGHVS